MSSTIQFKICVGDDVHRTSVPDSQFNTATVWPILRHTSGLARFHVTYVDDEGDIVTVTSDDELDEATRACGPRVLRLVVKPSTKALLSADETNAFVTLFNNGSNGSWRNAAEYAALKGVDGVDSLASLLFESCGVKLDRFALSRVLSKEENNNLLTAFVRHFDWRGLSLVAALRQAIGRVGLSGEAQAIDRTIQSFADRYCEQNTIHDKDDVHVSMYALVMLNTDLSQRGRRAKHRGMTLEQFLNNLRGMATSFTVDEKRQWFADIARHPLA
eukprot:TRINITY_DN2156_c0_g1_i1.p1 TRINITY_DN2156_c0_g1~~TRINITY_DN2156_c0_g1_i1.p1  ORF type:complete len:273 (+),score=53.93 TRINITY_DN2156_c0_g1_i1:44-862(+)